MFEKKIRPIEIPKKIVAISNIDLRVNSQHAVRNLRNAQTAS